MKRDNVRIHTYKDYTPNSHIKDAVSLNGHQSR